MDERGRDVVEEVGVVDGENEGPSARRLDEEGGATTEQVGPVVDTGFRP
jgi:hypothetical protein